VIDQIVRAGARRMLAEALQAEVDAAQFSDQRDEHGRRLVVRNGLRKAPPTALFTLNSRCTIGAVRTVQLLDLRGRVAIVGFDNFDTADLLDPPLTVVATTSLSSEAARQNASSRESRVDLWLSRLSAAGVAGAVGPASRSATGAGVRRGPWSDPDPDPSSPPMIT
jgi:hypothetical protein